MNGDILGPESSGPTPSPNDSIFEALPSHRNLPTTLRHFSVQSSDRSFPRSADFAPSVAVTRSARLIQMSAGSFAGRGGPRTKRSGRARREHRGPHTVPGTPLPDQVSGQACGLALRDHPSDGGATADHPVLGRPDRGARLFDKPTAG